MQQSMRSTYCYSDTQVFGEYPAYLLSRFRNKGINIVKETGDDEIMKAYPVDFVSFSYYHSSCVAADTTNLEQAAGNTITRREEPLCSLLRLGLADRPHRAADLHGRPLRPLPQAAVHR